MENKTPEPKKGGNQSRATLYNKASQHAIEMIDIMVEIARNGDNDNAKIAAARTLLSKAIPDLKALEISGDDVRPLIIKLDDNPTISNQTTGSLESSEGRQG